MAFDKGYERTKLEGNHDQSSQVEWKRIPEIWSAAKWKRRSRSTQISGVQVSEAKKSNLSDRQLIINGVNKRQPIDGCQVSTRPFLVASGRHQQQLKSSQRRMDQRVSILGITALSATKQQGETFATFRRRHVGNIDERHRNRTVNRLKLED